MVCACTARLSVIYIQLAQSTQFLIGAIHPQLLLTGLV